MCVCVYVCECVCVFVCVYIRTVRTSYSMSVVTYIRKYVRT